MTKQQAADLGRYVRSIRKSRHLSARCVAEHAGVDEAQILRIERGQVRTPQSTVLRDIADRLNVPMNDLFTLAGYPMSRTLPTIEPYLHAKYPRLDSDAVGRVTAVLQSELNLTDDLED